jgi:hypothetical protein
VNSEFVKTLAGTPPPRRRFIPNIKEANSRIEKLERLLAEKPDEPTPAQNNELHGRQRAVAAARIQTAAHIPEVAPDVTGRARMLATLRVRGQDTTTEESGAPLASGVTGRERMKATLKIATD